jgi:hypothetical protein
MERDLYKNIGDVDVCTEFEMLKVKVPIIFSAWRVFRYIGRDVTHLIYSIASRTDADSISFKNSFSGGR